MKGIEKLQGKAVIKSVEITEEIAASNEANDRLDVRLTFTYTDLPKQDKEVSELLKEIDPELLALAEKAGRSNTFNYLLDATALGYVASGKNADDPDEVVKELSKKLEGKELVFTTYRIQVGELLKGTKYETDGESAFNAVHTDTRAYTSFNASYLLVNDDEESVFNSVKNRIIRKLDEGTYYIGRNDDDGKRLSKYLKSLKAKEED